MSADLVFSLAYALAGLVTFVVLARVGWGEEYPGDPAGPILAVLGALVWPVLVAVLGFGWAVNTLYWAAKGGQR